MCRSVTVVTITTLTATSVLLLKMLSPSEQYWAERSALLAQEQSSFFGASLPLSEKESKVSRFLSKEKQKELYLAYHNSSQFLPAVHFFHAKEKIDQSPVFAIIRKMPKGASLHTHLAAAVSADFIIKNITYRDFLFVGYINDVFKLKFMADPSQDDRCNWTSIQDMRKKGMDVDALLRRELMLNGEKYQDIESVWKKFKKIFTATYDMFSFRPVFEDFVYQLLQELYDDNIMYSELKGTIFALYEIDGKVHSRRKFFEIFIETVERFKKDHPKFVGVKYIHSIYRGVEKEVLQAGLEEIIEMKKHFPDFIAGFDFVGFEEEGHCLKDYYKEILEAQKDLYFFFHAGETNWFGHTDLNLVDAILFNSFRIGHGFAITKHPRLLSLALERKIPLELCPISNQVLKLNDDPRNHPATHLMAIDYPLVVCNDDPSAWNATGLSYDWYVAFMAMTPEQSGLEVLKKFAINSIFYTAMAEEGKKLMMEEWERQWDVFLDGVLQSQEMS